MGLWRLGCQPSPRRPLPELTQDASAVGRRFPKKGYLATPTNRTTRAWARRSCADSAHIRACPAKLQKGPRFNPVSALQLVCFCCGCEFRRIAIRVCSKASTAGTLVLQLFDFRGLPLSVLLGVVRSCKPRSMTFSCL